MRQSNTVDSDSADAIRSADPGDAIAVRSSWGAFVCGKIGRVNDKPSGQLTPGDWVIGIDDPLMWDVSDGGGETIDVDGPGVAIHVGTDEFGFDFAGDLVLLQPAAFNADGKKRFRPLPAGPVDQIKVGADRRSEGAAD